jgi:hypothetical protein
MRPHPGTTNSTAQSALSVTPAHVCARVHWTCVGRGAHRALSARSVTKSQQLTRLDQIERLRALSVFGAGAREGRSTSDFA